MSIFGSIVSAIFGHGQAPAAASPTSTAAPTPAAAPPSAAAPTTSSAQKPMSQAEVVAMIEKAVGTQNLNWRQSIVDLMKALKLDSSLAARKELAQELGYTGALDGSAEMNIWLHKQVMAKLAEGGGTVPASLKVA